MKINKNHAYAHSTASVFSLFTDADEIKTKQKALGARNIRILSCKKNANGATVRFVRELPAEVPGILKRFLQPWNQVVQAEEWHVCDDGICRSALSIDISNVPVDVSGTLTLKPTDGGCVNQVRLTIDCGIPFVGKALAEFVAADCERLVAAEYDYIRKRLGPA
ncbi:MAG: DUF2505 domain-containing protein [Gammaproteobacteria bacterium]|nr:DUF2505 domain-containing protein [Gammaproteobacteria bacterium]